MFTDWVNNQSHVASLSWRTWSSCFPVSKSNTSQKKIHESANIDWIDTHLFEFRQHHACTNISMVIILLCTWSFGLLNLCSIVEKLSALIFMPFWFFSLSCHSSNSCYLCSVHNIFHQWLFSLLFHGISVVFSWTVVFGISLLSIFPLLIPHVTSVPSVAPRLLKQSNQELSTACI